MDLSKYGKIENHNGEYSINRTAENIIAGLFDIIFDGNFTNLNTEIKNHPAIDLGDKNKRIAVQVTFSNTDKSKVQDMLKNFMEKQMYKNYDHIYFCIISTEKPTFAQKKADEITAEEFTFPVENIININDLYGIIQNQGLSRIIKVRKYLERHLDRKGVVALLFGTKKRAAISISAFLLTAVALVLVIIFKINLQSNYINYDFDDHLILELSNANHQYNEGLNNWKRLDYNRAERDILAARDEISEHISQYEVEVARINNSLGCLYLDMGKYEQAYEYLNKALVTFDERLNDRSLEKRTVMFSIAQYDCSTGNYERALQTIESTLDITDPKKEPYLVGALNNLRASIYDSLGEYETALSAYVSVAQLYKDLFEKKGYGELLENTGIPLNKRDDYNTLINDILKNGNNEGETYIHLGNYGAAEQVFKMCLQICQENVYIGIENLTASKLYMNLAVAQNRLDKYGDAIKSIDKAMRIQRKLFDYNGDYPGLVEVYNVYAELLMEQDNYDEAKKYIDMAEELSIRSFGENHPITASTYNVLGMFFYGSERYADAIEAFSCAIEIRKNILGSDHPYTVRYYINLAEVQTMLGENSKAYDSLLEAEAICNKLGLSGSLPEEILAHMEEKGYD